MPTLTELSKELGVSTSTISRVLNNDETLSISSDTRNRIVKYATEVGYISKISKSKPNILLYYCNENEQKDLEDPFFQEIKEAVFNYCNQFSINLLYYRRGQIPSTTVNINGVIAIGTYSDNEIELLTNYSSNITFINSFTDLSMFDSIVVDDQQTIEFLVNSFVQNEQSSIDFIGGDEFVPYENKPKFNRRLHHFRYYTTHLGLANCGSYVGEYSYSSGYQIASKLIATSRFNPAIICASDSIANGVLNAFLDNGFKVPEDVQIVGINDDRFCVDARVPISSMRVHKHHLARFAIENVLTNIQKPTSMHKRIVLPTTFKSRETTEF